MNHRDVYISILCGIYRKAKRKMHYSWTLSIGRDNNDKNEEEYKDTIIVVPKLPIDRKKIVDNVNCNDKKKKLTSVQFNRHYNINIGMS